jgi:hypothetical protein
MRPDLAAGRVVNPQARDRAIPLPQKRVVRIEAVELTALERVVFDVAATVAPASRFPAACAAASAAA